MNLSGLAVNHISLIYTANRLHFLSVSDPVLYIFMAELLKI